MFIIERLSDVEGMVVLPELVELLQDSVDHGASIGFISPLQAKTAEQYWLETLAEVARRERILLVSRDSKSITGSVQLALTKKENGLHRAEVQKLFVHTRYRGRGIARALMFEIETVASEMGRTLLVLDTEQGSAAENLYATQGYQRVGVIPQYARSSNGSLQNTVLFYRVLEN